MRNYTYEPVKIMLIASIMFLGVLTCTMFASSVNTNASVTDSVATHSQQNMPLVIITISPSTSTATEVVYTTTDAYTERELHEMVMSVIREAETTDAPITEEPETTELIETTETTKSHADILEEQYFSVFSWQKYNGDFDKERLVYLADLCEVYDVPLELMLSIICAESSFSSTEINKVSSASGYCQIIQSTAEWVYENLLKRGDYDVKNHRTIMTTDWKLNLELGCRLVQWLYEQNNESWTATVCKYYGSYSQTDNLRYLNKVNEKMNELFDMNVSDM